MNDCLKCSYDRMEPKGERVCRKCGRPENIPKGKWQPPGSLGGILDLIGPIYEAPLTVENLVEVVCGEKTKDLVTESLSAATPVCGPATIGSVELTPVPDVKSLPAHSLMGGSAAHRFLNCSGSTALIAQLNIENEGDDPDYRRDGVQAHELAARCLDEEVDAWELVHEFPQLDPLAAAAVQQYVDYVRSRPGRRRVEVKIHLPDLSPLMFSTLDAVLTPVTGAGNLVLEVVDYKHGEGIFVDVEHNEQLQYYACMAIMEEPSFFSDAGRVRLTIVQPRISWADAVRSWDTTVGELKTWLYEVLLPAMRLEAEDMHLQMGEWCRFCPAKLVCPPHRQAFTVFAGGASELSELSDEVLGRDYVLTAAVKMRIKAVENEVFRRRMAGIDVPGSKIVRMKTDRVWKDEVELVAQGKFGLNAYTPARLLSPAMMEKLPEGKAFVAEWAYAPEAGFTVAQLDDKRKAATLPTPDEKYGDPSNFGVDQPAET